MNKDKISECIEIYKRTYYLLNSEEMRQKINDADIQVSKILEDNNFEKWAEEDKIDFLYNLSYYL